MGNTLRTPPPFLPRLRFCLVGRPALRLCRDLWADQWTAQGGRRPVGGPHPSLTSRRVAILSRRDRGLTVHAHGAVRNTTLIPLAFSTDAFRLPVPFPVLLLCLHQWTGLQTFAKAGHFSRFRLVQCFCGPVTEARTGAHSRCFGAGHWISQTHFYTHTFLTHTQSPTLTTNPTF